MTKIIGIISYLPDDEEKREKRFSKLKLLTNFIKEYFNLPIMIIAQNWKETDNIEDCQIYRYKSPLGVVEARKELRRIFLLRHTENYLIMLDDDCELKGSQQSVWLYLKQIDDHPNMFGEFNSSLLKLFAISRTILEQIDFDLVRPEYEEGFEDRIFVHRLRKKFPDHRFEFKHNGLEEYSVSTADPLSTWYTNQDITKMLDNTTQITKNITAD